MLKINVKGKRNGIVLKRTEVNIFFVKYAWRVQIVFSTKKA